MGKKLQIEEILIKDLKPAEYNPRQATEKEVEDLKESLKRFGFVEPIVVNSAPKRKNVIIGGHFRVKVAKDMGITKVPIVYVNIPDLKKEQELNLRLNKNLGHWDLDLLANYDAEMLLDTGFESEELDRIFDLDLEDTFVAQEEYEKVKEPKSKRGEIYRLGDHRVMCGDATSPEDLSKLMQDRKADMVFTDPPYNVDYKGTKFPGIMGDNQSEKEFIEFTIKFMARIKETLREGGVFYICSGYSSYPIFLYAIKVAGLTFSTPIVWVKNNTSLGWGDYRHKHETVMKGKKKKQKKKAQPILYGWNQGKHYFIDSRFEADVWTIKRRASQTMSHPTQKPIALIDRALRNSSKRKNVVADFFGGSGSTLIACEEAGRICYLMDLDPKWVDVIIARWEKYTGKKAKKG